MEISGKCFLVCPFIPLRSLSFSNQGAIQENFNLVSGDAVWNGQIVDNLGVRSLTYRRWDRRDASSAAASLTGRRIALALEQQDGLLANVMVTHSLQPFVECACTENFLFPGQSSDTTYLTFGNSSEVGLNNLVSFAKFESSGTTDQLSPDEAVFAQHTMLWQAPPMDTSAHSVLLFEGFWGPDSRRTDDNGNECVAFAYTCTLDAYWVQSSSTLNYSTNTNTITSEINSHEIDPKDPISISPEWAEKLTSL